MKKSKRVSWASGSKLCQVKLFQKTGPPIKVCQKIRKIPHRKPSNYPPTCPCPSAYVPFKQESDLNRQITKKLPMIPQINWEIPPVFVLKCNWLVASGEESEETKVQKLQESSVPEVVYAITSSPLDVEDCCLDDNQTPVIPIIPIEESDQSNDMLSSKSNGSKSAPVEDDDDTLLAAVANVTAIMRNMDPEIIIDTDLLVKLLKDPELTLKKINKIRLAANESKTWDPSNTELGRKPIEEVSSIPMLTSTPMLTKPLGQLTMNFTGAQSQMVTILNPIISPPVVSGSGLESSFTFKPEQNSNFLHTMQTEKAVSEQCHHRTNGENVVPAIPLPPLIHSQGEWTYGMKLTPEPPGIMHTKNAAIPTPYTHSAGERTYETGLTTTPRYPLYEGVHDNVGVGINPTAGIGPDLPVVKRMIRDYGFSHNSHGSEPSVARMDVSARPTQHSSVSVLPPLKYFSYYQFLINQHGDHQPLPQHNQTNMHIQKPKTKTQETCLYFNTAKGCRNGSRCLFRHQVFDQKNPIATQEAPDVKRMKLGLDREIIGRT